MIKQIYCFSNEQYFKDNLSKIDANVVFIENKNQLKLLDNKNEKIVIYDPDFAGWEFPNEILKYENIKGICLGTTTKSYIDEELCNKFNIPILNIPKYSTDSVAEYMFMLMFAIAKKLPLQIKNNFKQDFEEKYTQIQLTNKNVGIIGLGNIGKRFADMCKGIGMQVSYWNRNIKDCDYSYKDIQAIFKESDVILVALQTNEETKNIIKDDMLLSMKSNAILLSVAGGNLFNHNLVLKMVQNNDLFGYGLEVENKGVFDYVGNVMATSEYGWFTKESQEMRLKMWWENVKSLL